MSTNALCKIFWCVWHMDDARAHVALTRPGPTNEISVCFWEGHLVWGISTYTNSHKRSQPLGLQFDLVLITSYYYYIQPACCLTFSFSVDFSHAWWKLFMYCLLISYMPFFFLVMPRNARLLAVRLVAYRHLIIKKQQFVAKNEKRLRISLKKSTAISKFWEHGNKARRNPNFKVTVEFLDFWFTIGVLSMILNSSKHICTYHQNQDWARQCLPLLTRSTKTQQGPKRSNKSIKNYRRLSDAKRWAPLSETLMVTSKMPLSTSTVT